MASKETGKDRLYQQHGPVTDFVFDERVATVFTDMINRSVPGYGTIIAMAVWFQCFNFASMVAVTGAANSAVKGAEK